VFIVTHNLVSGAAIKDWTGNDAIDDFVNLGLVDRLAMPTCFLF
jgi:hypothetical protein